MRLEPLLAKSPRLGEAATLLRHTQAVVAAAEALFGTADQPTRLGQAWLRFFRVPPRLWDSFFRHLRLVAVLHDLGKANEEFQFLVSRQRGLQTLRHEHVSALLLVTPQMLDRLRARADLDLGLLLVTIAGHHLHLSEAGVGEWRSLRSRIRLLLHHPEVRAIWSLLEPNFGPMPAAWSSPLVWGEMEVRRLARTFRQVVDQAEERLEVEGGERRALWRAVKAALIVADAAGSAIPRVGMDLATWIRAAFAEPLEPTLIREAIIAHRLRVMERKLGRPVELHDFQREAAHLGDRALLLASCGAGKTLAAWNWAQARLTERQAGRVIFLYPTRATATEGFKDYGAHVGADLAALMHGTADYELEAMQTSPDFPDSGDQYRLDPRLPALAAWHRRVITATVDTFLPYLQYDYGALCLLPVLADSVLVLDEVHSYDNAMFLALQAFLREFDVPTLCMTATLTSRRQSLLAGLGLRVYPESTAQFQDLHVAAAYPRYRLLAISGEEAWGFLDRYLGQTGCRRVLWVVNRVARCQEVARRCRNRFRDRTITICYHSRFRLMDRQQRHQELMEVFRGSSQTVIAVTTQVAQMSLDIDADVLITEVAPAPDLIQRMGRCCREPVPPPGRVGTVLVYEPATPAPYTREELQDAWEMVRSLPSEQPVSQLDLAEALQALEDRKTWSRGHVPFVDDVTTAAPSGDFREGEDWTVDAVLDTDLPAVLERRRQKQPVDGYVLPVPFRAARADTRLDYLRVAPSERYDPQLGFLDQEVRETSGKAGDA